MKIAVPLCGQPRRLQQLVATIVSVYLVFRITAAFLPDTAIVTPASDEDSGPSDMVAAVNPVGGSGNNINLRLTLNMKSLMTYMDAQHDLIEKKKATPDAVQPDVEVLLQDTKRCDDLADVTWLIYVHTQPSRRSKRDILRKTWANEKLFKQRNTRVLFVMGSTRNVAIQREVHREFDLHRDIVQGQFIGDDDYSGTAMARMALKWVTTYCAKAKYILKVEDDTFVDIFYLIEIVAKQNGRGPLIACALWPEHSKLIVRDPHKCSAENVWCISNTEFPGKTHFPLHCDGIGYLVSSEMAKEMFLAVPTTSYFWLEEVYMTALLQARMKHIKYIDLVQSYTTSPVRAYKDPVKLNKRIYVFSKVPYAPNFSAIWEWTLRQLKSDELDLLSEDIVAQIRHVEKT